MKINFFLILLTPLFCFTQIDISKISKKLNPNSKTSQKEISKGLTEALSQGCNYAVTEASK